jgi:hypothetical protein
MDLHEKTDIYEIPESALELWALMHLRETEFEEGDFGGMAEEDYMGTLLGEDVLADPYVVLWLEYEQTAFYIDEAIKHFKFSAPDESRIKDFIVKRRQNRLKLVREGRELQEEHRWHGNISQC